MSGMPQLPQPNEEQLEPMGGTAPPENSGNGEDAHTEADALPIVPGTEEDCPENVRHLRPHMFKPGQSGNPNGRPKGRSVTQTLRRLMDKDYGGKTGAEIIAQVLFSRATKGNFQFLRELLERTEGKVPDRLAGPEGEPLVCGAEGETVKHILSDPQAMELALALQRRMREAQEAAPQLPPENKLGPEPNTREAQVEKPTG